jgi:hypothetical protein
MLNSGITPFAILLITNRGNFMGLKQNTYSRPMLIINWIK